MDFISLLVCILVFCHDNNGLVHEALSNMMLALVHNNHTLMMKIFLRHGFDPKPIITWNGGTATLYPHNWWTADLPCHAVSELPVPMGARVTGIAKAHDGRDDLWFCESTKDMASYLPVITQLSLKHHQHDLTIVWPSLNHHSAHLTITITQPSNGHDLPTN